MENINSFLLENFKSYSNCVKLPVSGSKRVYYRFLANDESFVLTENYNVEENNTFFYFTDLFRNLNGNVPEVLAKNKDKTLYIQQDLGKQSLLNLLEENRENGLKLYKETVIKLAHLQVGSHQIIDYSKAFDSTTFDEILALRDLFYFKDYFLDFSIIDYKQNKLLSEFQKLAKAIDSSDYKYFMFRDFQGRNVLIHENKPYFIDYQGGMKGPIAYDLASLLWQAKASLNKEEKELLYKTYTNTLQSLLPNKFNAEKFKNSYELCVLVRLLQVMGAYGKLGNIEQKEHFKQSIKFGIDNFREFSSYKIMESYPYLKLIMSELANQSKF